ncbi:MAG TPA: TOBE domain-containing protein, partial [Acidimicrobiales bacterium]
RVQMRAEIARLQRELGTTTIYVTHDQIEAMTMGDRVAVLNEGRLLQVAEPETLYAEPANLFVAAFIGSPSMNLLEGTFSLDGDGGGRVTLGDEQSLPVPASLLADRPALRAFDGRPVVVGIRPEHFWDASVTDRGDRDVGARLRAEVELREALGSELLVHLRIDARPAVTDEVRTLAAEADAAVVDALEQQAAHGRALVVARFESRSGARLGDVVEVGVETGELHLFDPETRLRIGSEVPTAPVTVADGGAAGAAEGETPADAGGLPGDAEMAAAAEQAEAGDTTTGTDNDPEDSPEGSGSVAAT